MIEISLHYNLKKLIVKQVTVPIHETQQNQTVWTVQLQGCVWRTIWMVTHYPGVVGWWQQTGIDSMTMAWIIHPNKCINNLTELLEATKISQKQFM